MATPIVLIEALRELLVAEGVAELPVVRRKRNGETELGNAGTLPVVVLDPRSGPWAPSGSVPVVLTLRRRGAIPQAIRERFVEVALVEVVCVATSSPAVELAQRSVRAALDDRQAFTAGTLRVEDSRLWTGATPLRTPDEATFASVQTFAVACRVRLLEGDVDP